MIELRVGRVVGVVRIEGSGIVVVGEGRGGAWGGGSGSGGICREISGGEGGIHRGRRDRGEMRNNNHTAKGNRGGSRRRSDAANRSSPTTS